LSDSSRHLSQAYSDELCLGYSNDATYEFFAETSQCCDVYAYAFNAECETDRVYTDAKCCPAPVTSTPTFSPTITYCPDTVEIQCFNECTPAVVNNPDPLGINLFDAIYFSWTGPSNEGTIPGIDQINGYEIYVECPTDAPTKTPTTKPTLSPTVSPSLSPTESPTPSPTISPTESPTAVPTVSPTYSPTESPTYNPTVSPTYSPTVSPTPSPTFGPTVAPTNFEFFDVNRIFVETTDCVLDLPISWEMPSNADENIENLWGFFVEIADRSGTGSISKYYALDTV